MTTGIPAVFFDRDGTLIADTGFVSDPQQVSLMPGASNSVRALRQAGFKIVVASNQSGVARGLFDEATVVAVNDRVQAMLGCDAGIDAFYFCPYLEGPEVVVEAYRRDSDWRKPRPGMLLTAAREHGLDLARSWMIGDAPRDMEAGRRAGCRTILVCGNGRTGAMADDAVAIADYVVDELTEAAALILEQAESNAEQDAGAGAQGPGREIRGPAAPPDLPFPRQLNENARETSNLPAESENVVVLLRQIRDELDRSGRRQRQADFSFVKLAATLVQLLAIAAAVSAAPALMDGDHAAATARLLLACFLQLMSWTLFHADRQN